MLQSRYIMDLEFGNAPTKVGIAASFSVFYKTKILVKFGMKLVSLMFGEKNQSLRPLFLIIKIIERSNFSRKTN